MTDVGKMLIWAGAALVAVGALILLVAKSGIRPGGLPGDIHIQRGNFTFYFPLGACIFLSLALTGLLYFVSRFRR